MPPQKRPAPTGPSTSTKSASAADLVGGAQGQNWKKRKQERAHTARFIETQTPTAASSSAGSSRTGSKSSTPVPAVLFSAASSTLPTSIDLESLVSSRAFQIQSFLRSIKSAKSATTTRAWQLLPRHARRRAASHNLLRLPSRLRSKALAELRSSTTQARTRSDIRKRLPSHGVIRATLRRKKLAQRAAHPQRRWLETHMWHAKRFRMTTEKGKGKERDQGTEYGKWGFVLPETTMMKSHRASWRSAREFVTVHDASYTSVFRVGTRVVGCGSGSDPDVDVEVGLMEQLQQHLAEAGFTKILGLDASRSSRVLDTTLVQKKADPQSSSSTTASVDLNMTAALAPVRIVLLPGTRRFERPTFDQSTYVYECKEALIFVHPSADLYVRRALKAARITMTDEKKNALFELEPPPAQVIQLYATQLTSAPDPWLAAGGKDSSLSKLEKKRRRQAYQTGSTKKSYEEAMDTSNNAESKSVVLDDKNLLLRQQGFNIFELVGPRAAPLLQSVLKVHRGDNHVIDESRLRQLLSKHNKVTTSMVEVRVNDPRLSYPPKLKPLSTDQDAKTDAEALHTSDLFWQGATPPRFSKGEIDSRRALNAIPGARLQPDSRDDVIPVVIIRDALVQKPAMDRYTLIVPRGWGTAFFLSLVATHQSGASSGARVLGQHQLKHQRLELAALASSAGVQKEQAQADLLSYPHNWLGTMAYAVSEKEAAQARHEEWSRRPKGKRSEYAFVSHKEWQAFQQSRSSEEVSAKLSRDRIGVARPYPFGGVRQWEWIVGNSERLFGKSTESKDFSQPWLVAQPASITLAAESTLLASNLASAMVAVKLSAVRKGTILPQSSLMLAPSFEDHLSWVHHLDSTDHPALVTNRTLTSGVKMEKSHLKALIDRRLEIMQLGRNAPQDSGVKRKDTIPAGDLWSSYVSEAFDPEELHERSADWNHAIGTVVDGDYSLGSGKGFGVGTITLRAWWEVRERQRRLDAMLGEEEKRGRRRRRNPVETENLLLMREVGTDVVRAVTACLIPLM
ncbi:related to Ribonucleases P/MRP protein subunit POP1 [Ustilago trichophora]|uniref:Related to Ribonucleases P/MRP protein subunit POP1 n=1 Tax=Ustilago trichophora TaxID=86804 RepID=A0A5C3E9N2_9BASI|nr:related to Ribonucleases P/MRP protein subunit POP1 [Ustilago trichophora]